jgi:RNA polymerase sigma-70 factor (ECF subfamily)
MRLWRILSPTFRDILRRTERGSNRAFWTPPLEQAQDGEMSLRPVDEREAVALRYGAGLSIREIARIAGTPQTTIKGRLHRGLRRLREDLG